MVRKRIPFKLFPIVVITDGEGDYPDEAVTNNIPVLWLINGKAQPPWGTSVTVSLE